MFTTPALPTTSEQSQSARSVRFDIQALRALAVMLVVVYHVATPLLSGGYVGVDVFFVISGFLITSHIVSSLVDRRSFSLTSFYARRIRRLIPASLTVLGATLLATWLWAPHTMWVEVGRQITASAFYVENWVLAFNATDYSAADANSSPVQHFWSLSTEEQFYIVWPVLILVLYWVAKKTRIGAYRVLGIGLGLLVAGSLVYSIVATAQDESFAYFITPTRAWEFGAGGLLALVWRPGLLPSRLAYICSWSGLILIVGAAFTFTDETAFPGWIAIVPVVGTLSVLAAGDVTGRFSTSQIFRLRPIQYVGDISYSLYLWHWPLFILLPFAVGAPLTAPLRIAVVVLSVLLAAVTKPLIEDRFRSVRGPRAGRMAGAHGNRSSGRWSVFAMMVVGVLALALPSSALANAASREIALATEAWNAALEAPPAGFGAGSLPTASSSTELRIIPDPLLAQADGLNEDGRVCQDSGAEVEPAACTYGSTATDATKVALVGDSHAGQWIPALEELGTKYNWNVTLLTRSGCPLSSAVPASGRSEDAAFCADWRSHVYSNLAESHYSAVFVSALASTKYVAKAGQSSEEAAVDGFEEAWRGVRETGASVVVIRDNPDPTTAGINDIVSCVQSNRTSLEECSMERDSALKENDPLLVAASKSDVALVDLSDRFCTQTKCPPVVGGVMVYRLYQHLTGTFVRTLAPSVEAEIKPQLPKLFAY